MRITKGYLQDKIEVPKNSIPENAKVMNGDRVVEEFQDITKRRLINEIYVLANGYMKDFDRVVVEQGRFVSQIKMPWGCNDEVG